MTRISLYGGDTGGEVCHFRLHLVSLRFFSVGHGFSLVSFGQLVLGRWTPGTFNCLN